MNKKMCLLCFVFFVVVKIRLNGSDLTNFLKMKQTNDILFTKFYYFTRKGGGGGMLTYIFFIKSYIIF